MREIVLSEQVRGLLRTAMVEESDLVAAVQQGRRVPNPERSVGHLKCRCRVAMRRPLDPETATLRELEVLLKETEVGLEVYAVRGLEADE